MNRLEGKVAIITGGNSGVGAATAEKFVKEGAKVVITARREAQLEEVAAKIRELGGEVLPVCSDISKPEDAKRVVAETLAAFGKIDILINNAGVLDNGLKAIDSFSDEDMDRVIDINTKGTMCMTREVAVEMAIGCAKRANANIGVGISGIAGPTGDTPTKPVGMVCFGFYINGVTSFKTMYFGNVGRNIVRSHSANFVLEYLLNRLG